MTDYVATRYIHS